MADSALDAREAASGAVAAGCERLVVVGGDGAVHQVLQSVAGTETILGIIPVGTGNDFAAALGDDGRKLDVSVARSLGPARSIDLLRTGSGTWIASVATLGFSAKVNARANAMTRPRGSMRYSLATLAELPRLAPVPLVVVADGVSHDLAITLGAVANTSLFGGGMKICPDADPTDGVMNITLVGPVRRFRLLTVFPKVFRGTHLSHPSVSTLTASSLRLDSRDPLELWADGERIGVLPMTIDVVPASLHIAAPATA